MDASLYFEQVESFSVSSSGLDSDPNVNVTLHLALLGCHSEIKRPFLQMTASVKDKTMLKMFDM